MDASFSDSSIHLAKKKAKLIFFLTLHCYTASCRPIRRTQGLELTSKASARPYPRQFYFHQNEEYCVCVGGGGGGGGVCVRGGGGGVMKNVCQFDNLFKFCQLPWVWRLYSDCKHFYDYSE